MFLWGNRQCRWIALIKANTVIVDCRIVNLFNKQSDRILSILLTFVISKLKIFSDINNYLGNCIPQILLCLIFLWAGRGHKAIAQKDIGNAVISFSSSDQFFINFNSITTCLYIHQNAWRTYQSKTSGKYNSEVEFW